METVCFVIEKDKWEGWFCDGACVKRLNLCIVTEFVKNGSLRDILANNSVKLAWAQKLKLLHSAALGINYLHSLFVKRGALKEIIADSSIRLP
ncbi:uncharacterized protein ACA1_267050 [Acanthamoeba castellanii str. Neff]|uniref:non-specific serine/threonine protein kinase n=1 Tax=Acanthamoeba castellanii (strain ATCC 30010 / Neff) TaxID=1257118 RepID=L8H3Z4_ACACF|nr:uncharacterized protein ACA1_267050 [Acanthamoeba castellanii str. Neff]ELR19448.1 hypothetical protein ACA1_267050 [Acanthamoeba castellanii str. Neff]